MTSHKNTGIPDGFQIDLNHFCAYCPNFKARTDVIEIESNNYGDVNKYYYTLTCEMIDSCRNIYKRILEEERMRKEGVK